MQAGENKFEQAMRTAPDAQSRSRSNAGANAGKRRFARGFTILELMIVITMMMILMAVAVPLYKNHVIQAREAVLKQNLSTINRVIEAYRLDKGQSPQSLDDLVTAGYLPSIPVDPITGKADWTADPEDPMNAVDPQQPGIGRVHSSSTATALDGQAYSSL